MVEGEHGKTSAADLYQIGILVYLVQCCLYCLLAVLHDFKE